MQFIDATTDRTLVSVIKSGYSTLDSFLENEELRYAFSNMETDILEMLQCKM